MLDPPGGGAGSLCQYGPAPLSQGPDAESRAEMALLCSPRQSQPVSGGGCWGSIAPERHMACLPPPVPPFLIRAGPRWAWNGGHAILCLGGADTSVLLSEKPPPPLLQRGVIITSPFMFQVEEAALSPTSCPGSVHSHDSPGFEGLPRVLGRGSTYLQMHREH